MLKFNNPIILSAKVKKSINTGLRIIIALLALWFIYRQVTEPGSFTTFREMFMAGKNESSFRIILIVVVLLMPVNWGIEAFKWKRLISFSERITLGESIRSVFTGISMSLFTPNRVGEFLGRSLTLDHTHILKGALLTIVGSISQLLTTLLFGSLALIFFIPQYYNTSGAYAKITYFLLSFAVLTLYIILLMMYLRVSAFSRITNALVSPRWHKIRAYLKVVRRLKREFLLEILSLSILRYLVFSTQFYLLLIAFGPYIPFFNCFILIAMTYFVMAAIPTIALADLGIRGSVSIYFISLYFNNSAGTDISILAASTTVWIINLAIPSLIGLLFINRIKLMRK
jgi:uncharacterized membrane protein YbhN (UPF0104 family)